MTSALSRLRALEQRFDGPIPPHLLAGAPSVSDVAAPLPGAWHVEIARASDGFVSAAFNWGADNRAEIEERARCWIEANGMRFGSRLIVATVEPLVERATGKEPR